MDPTTTQEGSKASGLNPDRVRIVSTRGTCDGRPRIDGHRITVADIAVWYERRGMSPDEIVSAYPMLTLSDVHVALAYYYDNREEIDASIEEDKEHAASLKAASGPSLVEQKLRRRKADASDDSVSS